jgi:D-3-phosphoglycerate dehydrogenase
MRHVVVVADHVAEDGLALLRAAPDLEVVVVAGRANLLDEALAHAHALLVRSDTTVTAERIARAPRLRVIGRAGTGVDNIDVEAATRHGVLVLNAPGANTISAAEHTIALLLAVLHRIPRAAASMADGRWERPQLAGRELYGKCLGLVGFGRIGARVAEIARALGMTVVAHDPLLPAERIVAGGAQPLSLADLLATADIVSLHLPLTDTTRHLFDRERLAAMKPGAILVNAARGGLIDPEALLEAVASGQIAGAALDVFEVEPLPAESPLRRSERLLLTPHLAASTQEAQARAATEICGYVRDFLIEGTVRGAVNMPAPASR